MPGEDRYRFLPGMPSVYLISRVDFPSVKSDALRKSNRDRTYYNIQSDARLSHVKFTKIHEILLHRLRVESRYYIKIKKEMLREAQSNASRRRDIEESAKKKKRRTTTGNRRERYKRILWLCAPFKTSNAMFTSGKLHRGRAESRLGDAGG